MLSWGYALVLLALVVVHANIKLLQLKSLAYLQLILLPSTPQKARMPFVCDYCIRQKENSSYLIFASVHQKDATSANEQDSSHGELHGSCLDKGDIAGSEHEGDSVNDVSEEHIDSSSGPNKNKLIGDLKAIFSSFKESDPNYISDVQSFISS